MRPDGVTESEPNDLARQQQAGGPQPGEVYRHYGGGVHVIIARSLMEGDLTPLVTYRSSLNGRFWTRTLKNFTEQLEMTPGISIPRFALVLG